MHIFHSLNCQGGLSIGLPPVLKFFQNKELQQKVARACLSGQQGICLAITEPSAGSDVANLKTTAKLSEDGKHYIVNGEKKWITNGVTSDWFTTAVRTGTNYHLDYCDYLSPSIELRVYEILMHLHVLALLSLSILHCTTGGAAHGGVSMLLIPRTEGVTTKQMQCQGVWMSGTTYVTFENVKVPVDHLIGKENQGFKYVMYNFNQVCKCNYTYMGILLRCCIIYKFQQLIALSNIAIVHAST
jgi:alkylation response protein AidB-like acyl-CoA dehydrogenase